MTPQPLLGKSHSSNAFLVHQEKPPLKKLKPLEVQYEMVKNSNLKKGDKKTKKSHQKAYEELVQK